MRKRIVITGVGLRTSNAYSFNDWVQSMDETMKCGQREITLFNTSQLRTNIAAQIEDELKYKDEPIERPTQIAYEAIDDLLQDESIKKLIEEEDGDVLLSYATSISGNAHVMSSYNFEGNEAGKQLYNITDYTTYVRKKLGTHGATYTTMSACAAGTAAAGVVIDAIRLGQSKVAIVGGADGLTYFTAAGFHGLNSLSAESCKPFDVNRKGINLGEGGAFFVFEEYEHAKARGAKLYAEVLGYAVTNEAYHITSPRPDGSGAAQVMREAMEDANIDFPVENIYVNAHGTGTVANDEMELKAITEVFKDYKEVYVGSTKAFTGHCLGAAGCVELATSIATLETNTIMGMPNTEEPMPTQDNIHLVTKPIKDAKIDLIVSNSFAFAGNDACIVLKAVNES